MDYEKWENRIERTANTIWLLTSLLLTALLILKAYGDIGEAGPAIVVGSVIGVGITAVLVPVFYHLDKFAKRQLSLKKRKPEAARLLYELDQQEIHQYYRNEAEVIHDFLWAVIESDSRIKELCGSKFNEVAYIVNNKDLTKIERYGLVTMPCTIRNIEKALK